MKSGTTAPLTEFVVVLYCVVGTQAGPMPNMNSTFLESVQGFLNKRSMSHSVG